MGSPAVAKAAATEQETSAASSSMLKGKASVSAAISASAKDSKGQIDLLA